MTFFWFRRDLRLQDNAGLFHALKNGAEVQPVFIFDKHILDHLEDRSDARVGFIYGEIERLQSELKALGGSLWVFYGKPDEVWGQLLKNHTIKNIFANRDYEPYALERDALVAQLIQTNGGELKLFKDHVIFEKDEVLKDDGTPYTVFTPYSRKWLAKLDSQTKRGESFYLSSYPTEKYLHRLAKGTFVHKPSLESMGFQPSQTHIPPKEVSVGLIKNYSAQRDFPAINGTSRLGVHFRFGTISIREKARKARFINATYLNELIWRDFYSQILSHFPRVAVSAFKREYERVEWRHSVEDFNAWCEGKTGYPLVDAGMRELNASGHMHNRVRMVVASFLTKHLLIDWRLGEAYFASKLLDFDLASNNGGWQWAAGCGTDAAPYFRIFNPTSQQAKFDPELKYIRRWIPEYGSEAYPKPIVDHDSARERCLAAYKAGLRK